MKHILTEKIFLKEWKRMIHFQCTNPIQNHTFKFKICFLHEGKKKMSSPEDAQESKSFNLKEVYIHISLMIEMMTSFFFPSAYSIFLFF